MRRRCAQGADWPSNTASALSTASVPSTAIKVALINWGSEPFTIENGDRIAQLVIAAYERVDWEETDTLDETERGAGGFGHTGV